MFRFRPLPKGSINNGSTPFTDLVAALRAEGALRVNPERLALAAAVRHGELHTGCSKVPDQAFLKLFWFPSNTQHALSPSIAAGRIDGSGSTLSHGILLYPACRSLVPDAPAVSHMQFKFWGGDLCRWVTWQEMASVWHSCVLPQRNSPYSSVMEPPSTPPANQRHATIVAI